MDVPSPRRLTKSSTQALRLQRPYDDPVDQRNQHGTAWEWGWRVSENNGFEDDCRSYNARGHAEVDTGLTVVSDSREIGSTVVIRAATGGRKAVLKIDEEERVEVENNGTHELHLLENRPYRLTLLDQHGQQLGNQVEIMPKVITPTLVRLSVPKSMTYADPTLRVDLQTRDAERTEVSWRMRKDAPWQAMDCTSGAYFAPVPSHPGVMQVRVLLLSRHAPFCKEGQLEEIKEVVISHPLPKATCTPSTRVLLKLEPVSCEIVCAWTSKVDIEWDGESRPLTADRDHRVREILSLDTRKIGKRSITVRMRGLDGRVRKEVFDFDVRARPVGVSVSESAPGRVRFDIKGAVRAYLLIPLRNLRIDIPCTSGTIIHEFVVPVAAILVVLDDEGKAHETRLVLDRGPHLRPPFSSR